MSAWSRFWIPAFEAYGQHRAPYLVKKMNINVNNAGSIGQYHDYEDPILGVDGHWEANELGEAMRVETACIVCDDLMRMTADSQCRSSFCKLIVSAMEQGTGRAMNRNYSVDIIALLTEGDEDCRFVHRIK